MLAERGTVENLAESFRQQCLDDSIESFGHLRNAVNINSPNVSYRNSSCACSIYGKDRAQKTFHERKNWIRNKCYRCKPLRNQKIHETFTETVKSTLPEIHFKIKPTEHLDKASSREILSSSEEELSELCARNKIEMPSNAEIQHLMAPSCQFGFKPPDKVQSTGTESCQNNKDLNRKRYKQPRGKTVKKIKLSRPSLDLDKMRATKMGCNWKFVLKNGNIFAPIDGT